MPAVHRSGSRWTLLKAGIENLMKMVTDWLRGQYSPSSSDLTSYSSSSERSLSLEGGAGMGVLCSKKVPNHSVSSYSSLQNGTVGLPWWYSFCCKTQMRKGKGTGNGKISKVIVAVVLTYGYKHQNTIACTSYSFTYKEV